MLRKAVAASLVLRTRAVIKEVSAPIQRTLAGRDAAPEREHEALFYSVFGPNSSTESQKMLDCVVHGGRQGWFMGWCVDQIHP